MLPNALHAQDYTYATNNGTITITKYTGPGGAVNIPDIINDLPVTSIGASAFQQCQNLTNVSIPNSVTTIGDQAFFYCTRLSSLTGGNSVTSIGNGAFYRCSGLTSVTIPTSVTSIGDGAFSHCSGLSVITVDALNSAHSSVAGVLFDKNQTALLQYPAGKAASQYTIPTSVTTIGYSAFAGCTSLTNITIPNRVTSIRDLAFSECSGLTRVTIPNSVTHIGDGAFSSCSGLSVITVDALNSNYSSMDGVLFNKNQTSLVQYPGGIVGSDYSIPVGVTIIGAWAFADCTSLTNVTIPNRVIFIRDGAFFGCSGLTRVTIPNSVTRIGTFTFFSCTKLIGVYFQGNAPIGSDFFTFTDKTTVYYLPGTTGWGPRFGSRPTALWKPLVQASDASFGVQTNQFGFNVSWASGRTVVLETCTNLAESVWSPLETNTLSGDSLYFSNPQYTNHPARFYRLRSL